MTHRNHQPVCCLVLALLPAAPATAAPPAADVEVSPAFQPQDFSRAVGTFFQMEARATPAELHVGDRVTLTLRVTARRGWQRRPDRLDLTAVPHFKEQFAIDPHPSSAPDREPAADVWEFDYVLRPRTTDVHEVPAIPLRYYNPRIAREDKRYATTWTHSLPLMVLPRGVVTAVASPLPEVPARFYEVATGPALLRHEEPFAPSWPAALAGLLVVPGLLVAVEIARRRLYPDAARRARHTQSQAAGHALRALRAAGGKGAAADVVGVVTAYLRQRFDLSASEPTPAEVRTHLANAGLSDGLAARVGEFFRTGDVARFSPKPSSAADLAARAADLILALETPTDAGRPVPTGAAALLVLLTVVAPLLAMETASPHDLLDGAITAFDNGVERRGRPEATPFFREAAKTFDVLWQQGARNPDLYRDQGNAHLLAGDLAGAILAYRRGLVLAPNDKALRANLASARDLVRYSSEDGFARPPVDRWPPWLPRLTARTCWVGFWCGYVALCLIFRRWWLTRDGRLRGALVMTVALTLALAAGLVTEARKDHWDATHPVVVVAADTAVLRQGNGTAYPLRSDTPLHAGVEARLRFVRGDWVQVELSRGTVGWLPRSAVLLDARE